MAKPWIESYRKLGVEWDRSPNVVAKHIDDYIFEYARDYPDRTALVHNGRETSYAELAKWSLCFADLLHTLGAREGEVIAIQMPNIPQYVIALVAAARLGLITTSISPLLSSRELVYQCNDAGVNYFFAVDLLYGLHSEALDNELDSLKRIITTGFDDTCDGLKAISRGGADAGQLPDNKKPIAFLDGINSANKTSAKASVDFGQVLYYQYTGGTTGEPKGVMLSSRHISTNCAQADQFYQYNLAEETVLSGFPLFHIGGIAVLYMALKSAATFILISDPRDLDRYCDEMEKFPPTIIANVPTLYQMLLNTERFCAHDFSHLRFAVSGAAPFSAQEIQRLEDVIGPGRFCEVYGMTETSPVQTLNPVNALKPGYAGMPLPGTDLRIVDPLDHSVELPIGEAGEVAVSGPQVMSGYLRNEKATSQVMQSEGGQQWLYTGDIGILDEDGYLKICDRCKDMLIVGGYKVFSVELEKALQTLPFVEHAAIIGKPDPARPGSEIVQAFVQCSRTDSASEEAMSQAITDFCRENMAPYKVPRDIHFVEALPLTAVGKLDKKALRIALESNSV